MVNDSYPAASLFAGLDPKIPCSVYIQQDMSSTIWNPVQVAKTVTVACCVLLSFYLIYLLRTPITWVFLALFLSLALNPMVSVLSKWMPRALAILLVFLGLIGSLSLIVILLVPPLVEQGGSLVDAAPGWVNDLKHQIEGSKLLQHWETKYKITDKLQSGVSGAGSHVGDVFGGAVGVAGAVFEHVVGAVTVLVMSAFMLASGPRWAEWIVAQAPAGRQAKWKSLTDRMGESVSGYVLGNVLISIVCGLGSWIVLLVLGVPYAGALALIVALLDLVPLIGAPLGAVVVGIVTLFIDFPTASIVWLIWSIAYQQIENHLLQPQVYKRTVNVHPLLVVIAILFGTTLMGILGALIAIPVAASIQVLLGNWWHERGREDLLPALEEKTAPESS